jgi:pyruvate formate lyase activating enzyme
MSVCGLCPRRCSLSEGQAGFCRARVMREGVSRPLGYGRLTSLALDPVEKKPLARYYPGSLILSAGSFGCNMNCYFCQNHAIARAGADENPWREFNPRELCDLAKELAPRGNIGLAFTYNEPMLNLEFIADCADILREAGLKTVVVTNGNFRLQAAGDTMKKVDAFNIDLKGFTEAWYRRLGGDLETVKAFIRAACQTSHVEVTTLVVPGQNDSPEEIDALARWLAEVGRDIPLHLSRYFPRYQASGAPTDRRALFGLAEIAKQYLRHVLVGNV